MVSLYVVVCVLLVVFISAIMAQIVYIYNEMNNDVRIGIVNKSRFKLPEYKTIGSVGMDLQLDLFSMLKERNNEKSPYVLFDEKCKVVPEFWTAPHLQGEMMFKVQQGGQDRSLQVVIPAGYTAILPTGIYVQIPLGYEIQIRPRSSSGLKGMIIPNSIGTIDCDYRGELKIIVNNNSSSPIVLNDGERVAQMICAKIERINWIERESLDSTERGEGGLGSTGK